MKPIGNALTTALCLAFAAMPVSASVVNYNVGINTTSIAGTGGYLEFQFNAGTPTPPDITGKVSGFTSGATLGVAQPTATAGNLPGTVTLDNLSGSDYLQAITSFGNSISFHIALSGPGIDTPDAFSGASTFAVFLFDPSFSPLLTSDSFGQVAVLVQNADGSTTATDFSAETTLAPGEASETPEPGTMLLLGFGIAAFVLVRRKKRMLPLAVAMAAPFIAGAATTSNWTAGPSLSTNPAARAYQTMAYDAAHGQTVLFGGGVAYGSTQYNDTWVWNGVFWNQKSPVNSPAPRSNSAMVYDAARGQVVLFGGLGNTPSGLADTWVWDGTNWTQKFPLTSPSSRFGHAMVYDSVRQQVILYGGTNGTTGSGETWAWDGTNWSQKASGPNRYYHQMAFDAARGQTVSFGGNYDTAVYLALFSNDTWVFDGNVWTQKNPPVKPPAIGWGAATYDAAHGQTVLFGGTYFSASSGYFNSAETWTWDGNTWTKRSPPTSPPGRIFPSLVYDSAHADLVMFGGSLNTISAGDTWIWNGATWTDNSPPPSIVTRTGAAMAYDSLHAQAVMFGGNGNGQYFNDTWVWNGSGWAKVFPVNSPPARSAHAMVFDSANGQVVLFGGLNQSGNLADTWVWDGGNWTQKSTNASPPAVSTHAMAYDSAHSQTVLCGGNLFAGTWTFDGTNWTQKSPAHNPCGRVQNAMAYDSVHGQVVMFGGGLFVNLQDTWVWDGTDWTKKTPLNVPPGRTGHAMAFDPARAQVVLFGGVGDSAVLADTWTWDGSNWSQRSPTYAPSARSGNAMSLDPLGHVVNMGGTNAGFGQSTIVTYSDSSYWDGGLLVSSGGFLYSRATSTYAGNVTLKNVEAGTITGPVTMVFNNLPAGVTLAHPTGMFNGTTPYLTLNAVTLAQGQTVSTQVQFNAPFPSQISFTAETYLGSTPQ